MKDLGLLVGYGFWITAICVSINYFILYINFLLIFKWLFENRRDEWPEFDETSYLPFFGASIWDNNFKRIKYIYNDKDTEVERVRKMKIQTRRLIKILIIIPALDVFFSFTIFIISSVTK